MNITTTIFLTAIVSVAAWTPQATAAPLLPNREMASNPVVTRVLYRRDVYIVGGVYYFNGHRGYLRPRPGYRYYNGYWFPGAAFAAGVVVGQAAPAVPPVPVLTPAHVRWCYSRYASYRAWDNSFQPFVGPRQECWSPYD